MLKLETPLATIKGVPPRLMKRLEALGLKTVRDLLWHFPARYDDFSTIYNIAELNPGQQATITGEIVEIGVKRTWKRKMFLTEAIISDGTASIRAIWFNQPYIKNILREGATANFAGKISDDEGELYLSNPAYEVVSQTGKRNRAYEPQHTARLVPIYPETRGLTSKGIRFLMKPVIDETERPKEFIPGDILEEYGFPELADALTHIHFPKDIDDALLAKKRFAFEELFLLQLFNIRQKEALAKESAPALSVKADFLPALTPKLPFVLTGAQERVLREIVADIRETAPMNRLLQGDVGSGKTVIAALAALVAAQNGYQTAFMAPTEVLAAQHFQTLKYLFKSFEQNIRVGLLTGSEAKVFYENDLEGKLAKKEFGEEIKSGKVQVVIGTHALIQKHVMFHNLGLVVIDEQHRFGVKQRQALLRGQKTDTTQTNADKNKKNTDADNDDELLYKDLTYKIRGCIFKVKNELGLGHKESIYHNALIEEFKNAGVPFETEKPLDIKYRDKKVGTYRPDFVIDNKVVIELKALPFIAETEKKQVWNYAKGTGYKLTLFVNFSPKSVDITRIINDPAAKKNGGLRQSANQSQQSSAMTPHFLSMSATPIPRTLTLTIFGDLDLSIIDEMPVGRKPIITKIVAPEKKRDAYAFVRGEVKKGRQVFVICPRIESADTLTNTDSPHTDQRGKNQRKSALASESPRKSATLWDDVKTVKEEYEKLSKKIFPDLRVVMLHGKMKPKEKQEVMQKFKNKEYDILVSTSVIEVGVDIPNANIMFIESADRFGLAQLYQFRGRVGRGEHQSYCLLFSDSASENTQSRLKALVDAKNGFELAEKDLEIRGPGQFLGTTQTGMPDIAMRALQNMELIKDARAAAEKVLKEDSAFSRYRALGVQLAAFQKEVHLE